LQKTSIMSGEEASEWFKVWIGFFSASIGIF